MYILYIIAIIATDDSVTMQITDYLDTQLKIILIWNLYLLVGNYSKKAMDSTEILLYFGS